MFLFFFFWSFPQWPRTDFLHQCLVLLLNHCMQGMLGYQTFKGVSPAGGNLLAINIPE